MDDLKDFTGGGMDNDSAKGKIAKNDYNGAYCLRNTGTSPEEGGECTNLESNELITTSLPSGINKTIGVQPFEVVAKAYSFGYNSQGFHTIKEFDPYTGIETVIFTNLTDSSGINILDLNPQYYVTDIKLIHGKFLPFTDSNMQPCYVNIERLKDGSYGVVTQEDLRLIKAQPKVIPTTEYKDDSNRSTNQLHSKLIQIIEQFVYLDNEYSAWSSYSKRAVPVNESTPAVGTDVSKSNWLLITVGAGTNRVKTLNIGARIGILDFALIKSVDRSDVVLLPNTSVDVANLVYEAYDPATNLYSFAFYNDGLYTNIDVLETDVDYDHVPLKAGAMEILNGSTMALGDITEGYPRPNPSVALEVTFYDAGVTIQTPSGSDYLVIQGWSQTINGAGGSAFNRVEIYFDGTVKTGDSISVVTANFDGVEYGTTTYTVPISQNDNTEAAIRSLAASMLYPTSVALENGLIILRFSTRRKSETPDGRTEYLKTVTRDLANAGTGDSISKPVIKTNSSYQLALEYKDAEGRYFPISTDNRYVIKTPSFSQLGGLTPKIQWQINDLVAPTGAATYQWLLSLNNTHENTLWVNAVLDVDESGSDYFVFNLNSLLNFNTNNSSSVLNYDYTIGDRATFVYKRIGSTDTYYDKIDVEVVGFEIDEVVTPPETNYFLKVRKVPSISIADLTNVNILLEIYTPRKRATTSTSGVTSYSEQLFFEIGEQFDVVNGEHSVLNGEITEGDVYLKTRQLENTIDDTIGTYTVEDFNFSDFYPSKFTSYGRARRYDDEEGEFRKEACIRYSDTFLKGEKVNGITRFFKENIYGEGAGETTSNYGAIAKMFQRGNYLIVLQDTNECHVGVYLKVLENQDTEQNIAISNDILGKARYMTGSWGIGRAKESFAVSKNGTIYFIDPNNSMPIRDGYDGVAPIGGKMTKFFKSTIQAAYKAGKKIIGIYNDDKDECQWTIEGEGDILTSFVFSASDWSFSDSYTITPSTLLQVGAASNGSVVINTTTGIATFTPTNNYVGSAGFAFSFVDGATIIKNTCGEVTVGSTDVFDFVFIDLTNQALITVLHSNPILVGGNNIPSPISITGGEYSVNGGAYTSSAGFVNNGDTVIVKQTTSASYSAMTSAVLTIGNQSDSFDVTTGAEGEAGEEVVITLQLIVPVDETGPATYGVKVTSPFGLQESLLFDSVRLTYNNGSGSTFIDFTGLITLGSMNLENSFENMITDAYSVPVIQILTAIPAEGTTVTNGIGNPFTLVFVP